MTTASRPGIGTYPDRLNRQSPGTHTQTGELPAYKRRDSHITNRTLRTSYRIYTIDELFLNVTLQRLAFGHWDVEGNEVSLLRAAEKTIQRDRPFFSVETFPRTNATRHSELLRQTNSLGYHCTVVDEVCGSPRDCRNMICIPNESSIAQCPQ